MQRNPEDHSPVACSLRAWPFSRAAPARSLPAIIVLSLLTANKEVKLAENEREVARLVQTLDEDVRRRQSLQVRGDSSGLHLSIHDSVPHERTRSTTEPPLSAACTA